MAPPEPITLSAETISGLPIGKGLCHKAGKHALILFKPADGGLLKATPNICLHMAQALAVDVEDAATMKCGMHGARLSLESMTYTSGPTFLKSMGTKCEAGSAQPQFSVTMNADGSATLVWPEGAAKGGACVVA